ncbi:MAG: outer membrane protein assembly factor BamD [Hyphomicrobiales bacterium]|nr:outer membrane protein assembly factor BamD [Hyphomicrobiales bacterium]
MTDSVYLRKSNSADGVSFLRGLRIIGAAVGLALVLGVAGCASKKDEDSESFSVEPADKLYNEGLALANRGRYSAAAAKFEDVDRNHPYSKWAKKSLVMIAYTSYESGAYDNAIQAGRRFVTLHPSSPDAAYAYYLIGQSYLNQMQDVSRDQERTQRALAAFNEVVTRFPESEYAEDSRLKIRVTRDQLAGKEMQVGRYYLERRNYIGAINRFRDVITEHQTTRHVEEALMRLTEAYMALGVVSEAQTAAAVLGHNFPDSKWYQDAYVLLQTGGLEPREDKNSWISRALRKTGLSRL